MPTYRWLKINTADPLEGKISNYQKALQIKNIDGLLVEEGNVVLNEKKLPKDYQKSLAFTRENSSVERVLTLKENTKIEEPVILDFAMNDKNNSLFDLIRIKAEKGSSAIFVLHYTSASTIPCFHSGYTSVEIEEGAKIKLIVSQMLAPADKHAGAVYVTVGENAYAEVLLGEMGAAQSVGSCNIELEGSKSRAELNGLYIGTDTQNKDFNYRIGFSGTETEGNITVKGALAGQTRKVMKSTIDFIKGASGAKGREQETVLVLSDKVINLSAPLLLCGEDNVEGEHATSTGKPDENKLYYLMSRGFSESQAKKLIVEASLAPILNRVEPEDIKKEWEKRIQGVMQNE